MLRIVVLVLAVGFNLAVVPARGRASFERAPADAEADALAGAGAARQVRHGRPFGNPALLGLARTCPLRVTSGRLYGIPALGASSLWGGRLAGPGAFALGAARLGGELYRELTLAAACGFAQGSTAYGVQVRALMLAVEGFGARWAVTSDWGLIRRIDGRLAVGVLGSTLGTRGGPPRDAFGRPRIVLGCSYRPEARVAVLLDFEQAAGAPRRTRVGLEILLADSLLLRVGRVTDPGEIALGVGLGRGWFGLDVGLQWHPVLGFSSQTSVRLGRGVDVGR